MHVLVGDVGGTKTVLAMAEVVGDEVHLEAELRLPSGDFSSFELLVRRYLDETAVVCDRAAFAVAGPVHNGRSQFTNLAWEIDERGLAVEFGWHSAHLLNDLEAVAWGIPALEPGDLAVLHAGADNAAGNACVVAAGTGLGEAGMYWDGCSHRPFAGEGGHTDFAPSMDREIELLRWLRARYGHVSWERLVSGAGIRNIYEFLCSESENLAVVGVSPGIGDDLAAAVSAGAADGSCALCIETMAMFASFYGREAGNMALKHMALGGVYLGGGIAPKNIALLRSSQFLDAFFAKGRMEPLMRRMPVKVILQSQTPLFGAARFISGK